MILSLNDYDLQWAETENKCPCCKERFNRIDRVKKLSLPATPPSSRRGKRKRDNTAANSGSNTRRRTSGIESSGGGGSCSWRDAYHFAMHVNDQHKLRAVMIFILAEGSPLKMCIFRFARIYISVVNCQ